MATSETERVVSIIERKLEVLRLALNSRNLAAIPRSLKLSSFAEWTDEKQGLERFSRLVFYGDNPTYKRLQLRIAETAGLIADLRNELRPGYARRAKKKQIDSQLTPQFVMQYAAGLAAHDSTMKKLMAAQKDNQTLKRKLNEAEAKYRELLKVHASKTRLTLV